MVLIPFGNEIFLNLSLEPIIMEEPKIRVKNFAKLGYSSPEKCGMITSMDIETISLSSEENLKTHTTQTARKKKERLTHTTFKSRSRKIKPPPEYKFHKISEYFQATKKDYKIKADNSKENESITRDESGEKSDLQHYTSSLRQVKIVLRRLSIEKTVQTNRKRIGQNGQTKLTDYNDYESTGDNYFKTYEQAQLPKPELTSKEIFSPPNNDGTSKNSAKAPHIAQNTAKIGITKGGSSSSNTKLIRSKKNGNKTIHVPKHKIIEGTNLAVDAFRYGEIANVQHYFLSHFHADHYIGLKKKFSHNLYVTHITARLVKEFIKVEERYIHRIDINLPIIVDEVEVTALDANHCPGAVMFLFKLKSGKCILHTGDFRASPDMEEYAELWNNQVDMIYLDTTYLSTKYEFQTQSDSIALINQYCHEFINSKEIAGNYLILCGAYKIGKEKVWLRIAQEFNCKVWVDKERLKVIQCIQNEDISEVLTTHPKDASIHVLPLGNISYKFIDTYVRQFGDHFSKFLAIRPSGWERQPSKPNFANRISIVGVQYSEHSSYNELERFVRFLRPTSVISTVPIKNMSNTPKIPEAWLNNKLVPKSKSYQRNISDFIVKARIGTEQTESDGYLSSNIHN